MKNNSLKNKIRTSLSQHSPFPTWLSLLYVRGNDNATAYGVSYTTSSKEGFAHDLY